MSMVPFSASARPSPPPSTSCSSPPRPPPPARLLRARPVTGTARLLRARPVTGTAAVWSASHQRLFDALNIDLGQLRVHVHHDATRWLRDAIDQARVERRLRQEGKPLPARNVVYIRALASEIRLAQAGIVPPDRLNLRK